MKIKYFHFLLFCFSALVALYNKFIFIPKAPGLTFFVSTKKSNKEKRKHTQKLLRSVEKLEKRTPSASLRLNAFFH